MKPPSLFSGIFCCSLLAMVSALADEAKLPEPSDSHNAVFTLIVLPDTQGYADTRHRETQKHWADIGDQRACFFRQTEWIKNN